MHLTGTEVEKIAIFRALQLGDLLCAIPAIRALKNEFPHASLTLIGLPWSEFMVQRFPHYFNEHIVFPGHPGLPEQEANIFAWPDFLTRVQQQNFSLVMQMHGSGNIVNGLIACFNASITAGYYIPGQYKPSPYFIPYPGALHEIYRHLKLVASIGLDATDPELEFPVLKSDHEELRKQELSLIPGSYVCIHPGARDPERQWDPFHFSKLADHCVELGYTAVITGSAAEFRLCEQVSASMLYGSINCAGRTSIGGVAALIANAKALISNCTGVAHIAAALRKKSLVVSLNDEPERWAPLNTRLHTTIVWNERRDLSEVVEAMDHVLYDPLLL